MSDGGVWRILFVDDDQEICRQVHEFLDGERLEKSDGRIEIVTENDFAHALAVLEASKFDIVILDVRREQGQDEGVDAGVIALESIRARRFLPVIFYTGLPNLVEDRRSNLVRVIEKTEGVDGLRDAIEDVLAYGLPSVNRALVRHLEEVQRTYMWEFVGPNWDDFGRHPDPADLAYLLARRLARSLDGAAIGNLIAELGGAGRAAGDGKAHPIQYYIVPPMPGGFPLAGDLYFGTVGGHTGHWVLLTPSCDFPEGGNRRCKAEWVKLARCVPLLDCEEYLEWAKGFPNSASELPGPVKRLMTNTRAGQHQPERYMFLPGALSVPDLVVDFQFTDRVARTDLNALERRASLDSPFAESLIVRFNRYFGRLGTPDLDLELIRERIGQRVNVAAS